MVRKKLKPGWARVTFGDVVRRITDRVDPATADIERFVAGDHMDTDDLRIRRWGVVGDGYLGPAFHVRFRPGQVLYGSRRTYLRKVALADFEGITANTTFVIEAKDPNILLPALLPFIMQTESFHKFSIEQSKGSVNPYVNFSDLAYYEVLLPPLEEQRRIARALNAVRTTQDRFRLSLRALESAREALVDSICSRDLRDYRAVRLGDYADVCYGLTISPGRRLAHANKVPYLRVANVLRGSVDLSDVKTTNELNGDEKYKLQSGDVLMVEGHANPFEIGRACVWMNQLPEMLHQNHVIRARFDEHQSPHYVCALINSLQGRAYFRSRAKSSSGLHTINSTVVKEYHLPLPPTPVQHAMVQRLQALDSLAGQLKDRQDKIDILARLVLQNLEAQ